MRFLLALGDNEPSRLVFCTVEDYLGNRESGKLNIFGSNVLNMLNVASEYGFLDDIVNMVRQGHRWSKDELKKRIWGRAWKLDKCFWRVQVARQRSLDLLSNVCGGTGYIVWWQISDVNHQLMKSCETMVRLVSYASLLRADDVRLKGSPIASRFCTSCDLAAEDDVRHLIMQCPKWQTERTSFLMEITSITDGSGQTLLESQCDLVYVFLGRKATDLTFEQMVVVWTILAKHISDMYNCKIKEGVG